MTSEGARRIQAVMDRGQLLWKWGGGVGRQCALLPGGLGGGSMIGFYLGRAGAEILSTV